MKKKAVLLAFISMLLSTAVVAGFIRPVAANLPIHNIDTGLDYATIQEAVSANETSSGDTILVDAGTYYEHVTISKSISLIGENRSTTVIDGNGTGNVINITANYVNVTGFTIRNGTNGIIIKLTDYNIISGNIVTDNQNGIHLFATCSCNPARENTIKNNAIENNSIGINLEISMDNDIYRNNFINNTVQADVTAGYVNTWDNGYPYGGNYWSDHVCTGNPSNGSQPYVIDEDNIDHYPFQDPNDWVLQGDLNGDGKVTIKDIGIIAIAFGSKPGDSNWNPDADVYEDDKITIKDIGVVAIHFGEYI